MCIRDRSNDIDRGDIRQSLQNILAKKVAELTETVKMMDADNLEQLLRRLENARMVQLAAVCNTWLLYTSFIGIINQIAQEHPILVDKYIMGKEIEVDAICDGTDILIPGIMQHIERPGIHSGDSISVYPAQDITQKNVDTLVEYTEKLARALHVKGMINIQFIVDGDDVYIIEVNPRSSRTRCV